MEIKELHAPSVQEASTQLSDQINHASYARQALFITRQGKPVEVLISYEEWMLLKNRKSTYKENPNSIIVDVGISMEVDSLSEGEKLAG